VHQHVRRQHEGQAKILVVVGADAQGCAHLQIVPQARRFTEIRLTSRRFAHAARAAKLFDGITPVPRL
jgi:ornithine cyclodeaminase/alanine dehydrogenase-like protein (mu-crystallin family)